MIMKVQIVLTDNSGATFEGVAELTPRLSSPPARRSTRSAGSPKSSPVQANFSTPIRAFIKVHARTLSGPKKFALLVAYLSKNNPGTKVALTDIERNWKKMTGLLGKFNPAHSTRAKDNGWVDSPKQGVYEIVPGWEVILNATEDN
jgi:hypothetical protein